MNPSAYLKTAFVLGLAGVLFSGYLSAIKLFTSACAFNEPCPYFMGYPACWYGFGLFLIIFISATLGVCKKISAKSAAKILMVVSGLGILFAGYFTVPEVKNLLSGIATNYSLGLPTCAYGLVFYIVIFIFSVWHLKKNGQNINGNI